MDKKHFKITVIGKVQGVYYRASTQEKALELGVLGFVRNQADGSVYIEAEAGEGTLNALVEWCWSGPKMARVDDVKVEEGPMKEFEKFEIGRMGL